MLKTFLIKFIALMILAFTLWFPQSTFAAELVFKIVPNDIVGDKAAIIEVRIDPKSKILNVAEGIISFRGIISDKLSVNIETGGSVMTLWPTPPQVSFWSGYYSF